MFSEIHKMSPPPEIATLVFDSSIEKAVTNVRAGQSGGLQQLIYSTNAADIALNIQPCNPGRRVNLMGQIMLDEDKSFDPFRIQLVHRTGATNNTLSDDIGEFAFEDIMPGEYQIVLHKGEMGILLPHILLKQ